MRSKEIKFRDPVVERVVDKFVSRSDVGFAKYGTTLEDERRLKMKGLCKFPKSSSVNSIVFSGFTGGKGSVFIGISLMAKTPIP